MSKNWFGPRDEVVSLSPPEGFEAVHQDGMSWYKNGINEFETTKKFAYEFNVEIAQLRGLLTVPGVDLSDLPENSPFLMREVILRSIMRLLESVDIEGYGLLSKAVYDPDDDGVIGVAQGGTGAATPAAARASLGAASPDDVAAAIAALVNSSPAALDTLNELAAALGNDPNFAATMTSALAAKAPLASPALTGVPTAPTQASGNNSTRIATTAFVQAAIAALVASSPAALDTLNELAAALGNDPNFATTMTNSLASKAPLASPALTGNPTAPTQASGNSSTRIASTAFVQAAIASAAAGAKAWVNFNGTGTVTINGSDNVTSITDNGTGDFTLNFGTALVDANYAVIGSAKRGGLSESLTMYQHTLVAGSARVVFGAGSFNPTDPDKAAVAVFR